MGEKSDQGLLRSTIIAKSKADNWEEAKTEWKLLTIYDQENHCVCKHAIVENCVIRNRRTKKELIVGNVCINHFEEPSIEVPKVCRSSLKAVFRKPRVTSANKRLIQVAVRLQILSKAEGRKYTSITSGPGSRLHFDKDHDRFQRWMYDLRKKMNRLIMYGFHPKRPRCHCGEFAKPRQNGTTDTYFYSCFSGSYKYGQWSSECDFSRSIT